MAGLKFFLNWNLSRCRQARFCGDDQIIKYRARIAAVDVPLTTAIIRKRVSVLDTNEQTPEEMYGISSTSGIGVHDDLVVA